MANRASRKPARAVDADEPAPPGPLRHEVRHGDLLWTVHSPVQEGNSWEVVEHDLAPGRERPRFRTHGFSTEEKAMAALDRIVETGKEVAWSARHAELYKRRVQAERAYHEVTARRSRIELAREASDVPEFVAGVQAALAALDGSIGTARRAAEHARQDEWDHNNADSVVFELRRYERLWRIYARWEGNGNGVERWWTSAEWRVEDDGLAKIRWTWDFADEATAREAVEISDGKGVKAVRTFALTTPWKGRWQPADKPESAAEPVTKPAPEPTRPARRSPPPARTSFGQADLFA